MENTWERLRANLNKLKQAVCKLPFNLQPWTEKGREPSASALEKSAFVERLLHLNRDGFTIQYVTDVLGHGVPEWSVDVFIV